MKTVFAGVEQISSQQMLYALIILCLLLVILMLIAVFVQNKRAKVAESQADRKSTRLNSSHPK